jgi:hypothetical protein
MDKGSIRCQLIAMTGTSTTTMDEVVLVILKLDTPDREELLQQLTLASQFEEMEKC